MNGDLREEMMCTLSDRQTGEGGQGLSKNCRTLQDWVLSYGRMMNLDTNFSVRGT